MSPNNALKSGKMHLMTYLIDREFIATIFALVFPIAAGTSKDCFARELLNLVQGGSFVFAIHGYATLRKGTMRLDGVPWSPLFAALSGVGSRLAGHNSTALPFTTFSRLRRWAARDNQHGEYY